MSKAEAIAVEVRVLRNLARAIRKSRDAWHLQATRGDKFGIGYVEACRRIADFASDRAKALAARGALKRRAKKPAKRRAKR